MNGLKNKILYGLCILTFAGGVISYQEKIKYEKEANQSLTEQVRKIDAIYYQLPNRVKPYIKDIPGLTQLVERMNSQLEPILKQHPKAISEWEDHYRNSGIAIVYGVLAGMLGIIGVSLGIDAIRRNKKAKV